MRLTGLSSTLLAMCLVSYSVPLSAAGKAHALHLIKQEPLEDTDVAFINGQFQIHVKENKYLNPIKSRELLHSKATVVKLRADESGGKVLRGKMDDSVAMLKGKVEATGKAMPLKGKVDASGVALKAKADTTGKPLKGKVDKAATALKGKVAQEDVAQTPLNTLEHGIKPPFALDLKKLEAELAPSLSYQLESELAAARLKAASLQPQVALMERELHSPQPRPDVPAEPARVNVAVDVTRSLQNKLTRSVENTKSSEQNAAKQLRVAFSKAAGTGAPMPALPGAGIRHAPQIPKKYLPGIPAVNSSTSKVDVSSAKQQMEGQLSHANQQPPSVAELAAQQEAAKRQSQVAVSTAQPAMDMVLTHLRKVPVIKLPGANSGQDVHGDASASIDWDKWHFHFAQLARGPILTSLSKLPNSTGLNTIEITVSRDHRLTARIVQPSNNTAYDQAILKAYRSLDGNGGLEYPAGAKRKSITFSIDNEHKGAGVPSAVNSTTAVGDKEIVRY